jgi:general nucleoside transport system ATP-binding protein
MSTPRLELRRITKRYPAVLANDAVSLTVRPGEAHAVLGENGAGKSTLMKIIYGATQADDGYVLFNGEAVQVRNPQAARALGISMVFQHFSLFHTLTVAENVWLGLDKSLSLATVTRSIAAKASHYGLDIDPSRPVHSLSVGEMQRVEIIRALLTQPQLLILDEPTSVLTPQAVEKLFAVLNQLVSEGVSILYISHKLNEIRELCTACTVLQGGRVTGLCNPQYESNESLSRMMIGSEPPALKHKPLKRGRMVLDAHHLSLEKSDPFGVTLHDVSLEVRSGEVVGIAGVSGNGQKELFATLSGEDHRTTGNMVSLFDQPVGRTGAQQRRALGLHCVPEERLGRGAVPMLSLAHNLLLTRTESVGRGGWLDLTAMRAQAQGIITRFRVKAGGPESEAKSLSGGNLQKFIVGREIDAAPLMLIVSQPTWGVDVGAAAQIRSAILTLRDSGCAVLVISDELDELMELSDRLYVMAKGRLSPSVRRDKATPELLGEWMSGLWPKVGASQSISSMDALDSMGSEGHTSSLGHASLSPASLPPHRSEGRHAAA